MFIVVSFCIKFNLFIYLYDVIYLLLDSKVWLLRMGFENGCYFATFLFCYFQYDTCQDLSMDETGKVIMTSIQNFI